MSTDLIVVTISFLLTIMVLSYLVFGDNPFFRVATYTFVGVAAAYVVLISFEQVIWTRLLVPLISDPVGNLGLLVPFFLGFLLLLKIFPRVSGLGNPAVAYLVGIGAAVTIGGATLGTIFPQAIATTALFGRGPDGASPNLLYGLFVLLGVASTLVYFHFGARVQPGLQPTRHPLVELAARVGQVFLAITLGSIFVGVYLASLSALIERLTFLVRAFLPS